MPQSLADWKGVTPERLDEIMTETLITRFRLPMLKSETDACLVAFKDDPAIIKLLQTGTWTKYDFTAMDLIDPIEDTRCAATKVFLQRDGNGKNTCQIIVVGGVHVYRTDSSFGIASLYALQGASYHVLFVVHPALHFPMDSVNAITKTSVPMGHPLFQLFLPHSAYSLPLDNGVLEASNSVVNNNAQGTRFDPLTANAYNLKLLFGAGYSGLGPKDGPQYDPAAYPEFDYINPQFFDADRHPLFNSFFGKWLAEYFNQAFLPFCTKIAKHIINNDDSNLLGYVQNWARYCNTHVKGFPTAKEISDVETLAKVMAIYIWNNSVSHGGDHWSFANQVTPVEKCLRIRRAPPKTRNEAAVNNGDPAGRIFTPSDMQRAALCQYMFFQAWAIVPNLVDTRYAFTDPGLLAAAAEFNDDLKSVNSKLCHPITPKGGPDPTEAVTNCQSLVPILDPVVPYERTIPQSIQY